MPRLIIFLLILIASVWLGIEVIRHPGYLVLVYQPYLVQMPLWFSILSLLIVFFLFYLLIESIDSVRLLWFRFKNWIRFRHEKQLYSKTQQGLAALIEGQWKKSERLLISGASTTNDPIINYLAAAKAAHELGAFERRDKYFKKAYQIAPKSGLAIGLTQATLELEQDKLEHACATLNHLRQIEPRHPQVLKLLEKVYIRMADWQNLLILVPQMLKARLITSLEYEQFIKNIYCEIFQSSQTKSIDAIQHIWNNIPHKFKRNADILAAYIKQLQRFPNTAKEIEELIRKSLKHSWQPQLVKIYGDLEFNDLNRQLVIVGNWLKTYGPHPESLLILGKLCARLQLWGRAKDYFEKCLHLGPNAEASLEYGKLLEHLGEPDEAMEKYRNGLNRLASLC